MSELECIRCGYCCEEVEIKVADLLFPEVFLDPRGLEFYKARGFEQLVKTNGMVRILLRCPNLSGHDNCILHGKDKPKYCQEWECHRPLRDSKWFEDRLGEEAVRSLEKISTFLKTIDYFNKETFDNVLEITEEYEIKKGELEGGIYNG